MKEYTLRKKVVIVGSGSVGSTIAFAFSLYNLVSEIVLIDINESLSVGEAMDIGHGFSFFGELKIINGEYRDIKDADLIIITAGIPRRVDQTRHELLKNNIKIIDDISIGINRYYNSGVIIVVSNPVDTLTNRLIEVLDIPKSKIFGTGCSLDSSRFTHTLASILDVQISDVIAYVVGGHNENQVLVWSQVRIKGQKIEEYCYNNGIAFNDNFKMSIEKKIIDMGKEIISRKGKTNFGIASTVLSIAEAIINNRTIVSSVCSMMTGEYDVYDIAISLPTIITKNGISVVITDFLSPQEIEQFRLSAKYLNDIVSTI